MRPGVSQKTPSCGDGKLCCWHLWSCFISLLAQHQLRGHVARQVVLHRAHGEQERGWKWSTAQDEGVVHVLCGECAGGKPGCCCAVIPNLPVQGRAGKHFRVPQERASAPRPSHASARARRRGPAHSPSLCKGRAGRPSYAVAPPSPLHGRRAPAGAGRAAHAPERPHPAASHPGSCVTTALAATRGATADQLQRRLRAARCEQQHASAAGLSLPPRQGELEGEGVSGCLSTRSEAACGGGRAQCGAVAWRRTRPPPPRGWRCSRARASCPERRLPRHVWSTSSMNAPRHGPARWVHAATAADRQAQ